MSRPHVALVGLPGVGKSTVARLVADRLDSVAVDLDDVIVERTGVPIADTFGSAGEAAFRDLESDVLAAVVAPDTPPLVIACGGGAVLRPANCDVLRLRTRCVWLDADTAALVQRVAAGSSVRPLLATASGSTAALADRIDALRGERAELYRSVAEVIVEVGDATPAIVAERVVAALGEPARVES